MAFKITLVPAESASEVADFNCAASGGATEAAVKGVTRRMREGKLFVARRRGRIIATLFLTTRKPWAIDASYFTKVRLPLYLLGMAVAPALQRKGIGRLCLLEAEKIAAAWPAQAIRLDAYDSPTGAGGFYQRCGYREVGRAVYRQTPLIYYERLFEPAFKAGDAAVASVESELSSFIDKFEPAADGLASPKVIKLIALPH